MNVKLKNYNNTTLNVVDTKTHKYTGEKIDVSEHSFDFKKVLSLNSYVTYTNTQACVVWDKYLFVTKYASSNATLLVFDRTNGSYLTSINLNTNVHCNVLNFSNEYYNGNDIPTLFASEWNGSKRYFVFNLVKSSDTSWSSTLVQTITTSNLSTDKFGAGNSDMCIDTENNFLYTITYNNNSYLATNNNTYRICKFNLPKVSDGSAKALADSDIIEYFDVPCYSARQDACCFRDKIYILSGLVEDSEVRAVDPHTHLLVVDPFKKLIVSHILLDNLNNNIEPEGIFVDSGYMYMMFQSDPSVYRFDF